MVQTIWEDGYTILRSAIQAVLPDEAVRRALTGKHFSGNIILVAVGKAAWQMANTAVQCLGNQIRQGIVITKYGHVMGPLDRCVCCEAGHPIPDENSFAATEKAMQLVSGLTNKDTVIFLLSGGGSALFESPRISSGELQEITAQLLARGADIVEINTIRKRLSSVKGGRFAELCAPAQVYSVILSDILGDPLDMIASGPTCPDSSTCRQALDTAARYRLALSPEALAQLRQETPKELQNIENHVTGSVRNLCKAAADSCRSLGYTPILLTDRLCCEAREAGSFLASIARSHMDTQQSLAYIAGGETIVHLTGNGKGGRNQELALSSAEGLRGLKDVLLFSIGSDGTDGPTDAAGGMVDGETAEKLDAQGIRIPDVLAANDAYHALRAANGLVITGATGTNVNDVAILLIRR